MSFTEDDEVIIEDNGITGDIDSILDVIRELVYIIHNDGEKVEIVVKIKK